MKSLKMTPGTKLGHLPASSEGADVFSKIASKMVAVGIEPATFPKKACENASAE